MQQALFIVEQKPPVFVTDNTIITFGKYKGKKRMHQIPATYLLWLYNKGCRHNGVRAYIISNLAAITAAAGKIPHR